MEMRYVNEHDCGIMLVEQITICRINSIYNHNQIAAQVSFHNYSQQDTFPKRDKNICPFSEGYKMVKTWLTTVTPCAILI